MADNLRKFLALPAHEKQQLLLAALWLPLEHLKLKCLGLQSCLRSMELEAGGGGWRGREQPSAKQREQALLCGRSVALASRHGLVAGTCLSRSLTVMRLLARQKIPGRLRVGVRLNGGALDAHAWVEVGSAPLEQGTLEFETFPPFEGANHPAGDYSSHTSAHERDRRDNPF